MHRYHVWQLAAAISMLSGTEALAGRDGDGPVPRERIDQFYRPAIELARQQCALAELSAAIVRCDRFLIALRDGLHWSDLRNQAKFLIEAIQGELRFRQFAFVPAAKATTLDNVSKDWADVWAKFPSSREDTERAVDCYALAQNTACIFHLMRIVERGLHALAKERKVKLPKKRPLEWAQWNDILIVITKAADLIANRKAGPARDAALEFYRGALGEFHAFKDVYRNHVMHSRSEYDEYQAASVLAHVLGFMKRLAAKIDENPKKSIKWGIK